VKNNPKPSFCQAKKPGNTKFFLNPEINPEVLRSKVLLGCFTVDGITPKQKSNEKNTDVISLDNYRWKKHCRGLFQLPIAA